jgi:hypothetical protein
MSSTIPSRRPSLAILYDNLKAQSDPYEELENAAQLFPMEDDEPEVTKTYVAPSAAPTYTPSPSPPFDNDNDSDSESDSSSDSDSDVEPMDLNATYADSVV